VKEAVTKATETSGATEEAAGAALVEGGATLVEGIAELGNALRGGKYDVNTVLKVGEQTIKAAKKAGIEAGIEAGAGPAVEAAVGVVMENFDDFAFIAALDKCATLTGSDRNAFVLQIVEKFPNRFNEETCLEAFKEIKDPNEGALLCGICLALEGNDIAKCEWITDKANRDLCKGYIIETKCADIKDSVQRDECYNNKAGECGCTIACKEIKDQDKQNLCLAKVTGDNKYCKDINADEVRDKCLGIRDVGELFWDSDLDDLLPSLKSLMPITKYVVDKASREVLYNEEGATVDARMEFSGEWELEGKMTGISESVTAFQSQAMAAKHFDMMVKYFDEGEYLSHPVGVTNIRKPSEGRVLLVDFFSSGATGRLTRLYKYTVIEMTINRDGLPAPVPAIEAVAKDLETKAINVVDRAMERTSK
jgi:hypothetical protein